MMRYACIAAAMIVWCSSTAKAQQIATSFDDLALSTRVGETVYVVDATGAEEKARIFSVSKTTLALAIDGLYREFRPGEIRRVERRRKDPVQNGVLIGAGSGALMGFMLGRRLDSPSCSTDCHQGALIGATGGAFWGGMAGWIGDLLVRTREVLYAPLGH